MTNKYKAYCCECGGYVPARGGSLKKENGKWQVRHLACENGSQVNTYTFSSGDSITINKNGRCEDAPCCGCCSG